MGFSLVFWLYHNNSLPWFSNQSQALVQILDERESTRAYINMDNGSPWVTPSLLNMTSVVPDPWLVLNKNGEHLGHNTLEFLNAASRLTSTSWSPHPVPAFTSNISSIVCTAPFSTRLFVPTHFYIYPCGKSHCLPKDPPEHLSHWDEPLDIYPVQASGLT